jgi:hypothetical protein
MACPQRSLRCGMNGSEATSFQYRKWTLRNRTNNTSKSGTHNKRNTKNFRGIVEQHEVLVTTDVTWQRQLNNTSSLLVRNYTSGQFGAQWKEYTPVSVLCLFVSLDSVVDYWLDSSRDGVRFPVEVKDFFLSKASKLPAGPSQPPIPYVTGPEVD